MNFDRFSLIKISYPLFGHGHAQGTRTRSGDTDTLRAQGHAQGTRTRSGDTDTDTDTLRGHGHVTVETRKSFKLGICIVLINRNIYNLGVVHFHYLSVITRLDFIKGL